MPGTLVGCFENSAAVRAFEFNRHVRRPPTELNKDEFWQNALKYKKAVWVGFAIPTRPAGAPAIIPHYTNTVRVKQPAIWTISMVSRQEPVRETWIGNRWAILQDTENQF